MTGGEAFLLDPDERLVNGDLVALVPLERRRAERLVELLERHARLTGSARAAALLADRGRGRSPASGGSCRAPSWSSARRAKRDASPPDA